MDFPVYRDMLNAMDDEKNVPGKFVRGVVLHRIIGEVFKRAADGNSRYSCDIANDDAIPFVTRLLELFPDCEISIQGNVQPGWASLTISWT